MLFNMMQRSGRCFLRVVTPIRIPVLRAVILRAPAVFLPVLLLLVSPSLYAPSLHAQSLRAPASGLLPMDSPAHQLEQLAMIRPFDHPGFGRWPVALGDLDGDGCGELAVASAADTTFIFLGGSPFDHEPDLVVLGGANGLAAGDFDGDGRTDLATAIWDRGSESDSAHRGKIRIYLNRGGWPAYAEPADRIITGGYDWATFGYNFATGYRPGIFTADMNGDKIDDLFFRAVRLEDTVKHRIHMILGGADIRTAPVHYTFTFGQRFNRMYGKYAEEYMTGDLNGDGCDDLCIFGIWIDMHNYPQNFVDTWFGNPDARFDEPDVTGSEPDDWVPYRITSNVVDINGDGYDDVINGWSTLFAGAKLFRSRATFDRLVPNDSIPNQRPNVNVAPAIVSPMGDMNGDGRPDLIVGWSTIIIQGTVYYVYPAGPVSDWKTATGYIGLIPFGDYVKKPPFNAGDVNGDGYDDMVICGFPTRVEQRGITDRIHIYSGSQKLTAVAPPPAIALNSDLTAYPQPLRQGGTLQVRLDSRAPGTIVMTDLLGRVLLRRSVDAAFEARTLELPTSPLPRGTYVLALLRGDGSRQARTIVIY